MSALASYERKTRDAVELNNPIQRWDLYKAWDDAQPLLKLARWQYRGIRDEHTPVIQWEMAADTDEEKNNLYKLIAGIVARQILEPESGYALLRVEMRAGGEMGLFISGPMQQLLRNDPQYPRAKYEGLKNAETSAFRLFSLAWWKEFFKAGR